MVDYKEVRVNSLFFRGCLQMFKKNSADVLRHFVIMNETWIHRYRPKTK